MSSIAMQLKWRFCYLIVAVLQLVIDSLWRDINVYSSVQFNSYIWSLNFNVCCCFTCIHICCIIFSDVFITYCFVSLTTLLWQQLAQQIFFLDFLHSWSYAGHIFALCILPQNLHFLFFPSFCPSLVPSGSFEPLYTFFW